MRTSHTSAFQRATEGVGRSPDVAVCLLFFCTLFSTGCVPSAFMRGHGPEVLDAGETQLLVGGAAAYSKLSSEDDAVIAGWPAIQRRVGLGEQVEYELGIAGYSPYGLLRYQFEDDTEFPISAEAGIQSNLIVASAFGGLSCGWDLESIVPYVSYQYHVGYIRDTEPTFEGFISGGERWSFDRHVFAAGTEFTELAWWMPSACEIIYSYELALGTDDGDVGINTYALGATWTVW